MKTLVFRVHAVQRMFQRHIDESTVKSVLETGEVLDHYPNDKPYPSRWVLGWVGSRPLHVVAADSLDVEETIVITVYEPALERWEPGFRKRRKP